MGARGAARGGGYGAATRQPAPPTAQFTSTPPGLVQGTDGCNRYSVPFTVAGGGALSVGPRGMSSQMACPPDVTARAEAFMAALTGAKSYRIVDGGGRLQLLSASGGVLATMTRQSTSLVGTWEVTGINNGRQAVVGLLGNAPIDMVFTADGQVSGSAGCNRFNAGFEAEGSGGAARFTPARTTRMSCPDEAVMQQEREFIAALGTVTTMRMDGDQLEFRTADGAMALLLRRVPR